MPGSHAELPDRRRLCARDRLSGGVAVKPRTQSKAPSDVAETGPPPARRAYPPPGGSAADVRSHGNEVQEVVPAHLGGAASGHDERRPARKRRTAEDAIGGRARHPAEIAADRPMAVARQVSRALGRTARQTADLWRAPRRRR